MQRFCVVIGNFLMAHSAGTKGIGGTFHHPFVGRILALSLLIPFMAQPATQAQMRIFFQQSPVYDIPLVALLRPNWRRRSRSPLALFTGSDNRWFMKGFHQYFVGMTLDATARLGH